MGSKDRLSAPRSGGCGRHGGRTSVVWPVRVAFGDAVAWRRVGVLDPEALAGRRDEPSPGLLSFLASLD
jgi:hypothetical protein